MKRSKHSLSHYALSTFNMGQLVPVGLIDVLPGDSVRMQTSMLMRLSPLVTPVMHPVQVRLHTWYVPLRIIWDEFENFITGGTDGEGDGAVVPTFAASGVLPGTIGDYFGIPPGGDPAVQISRLPYYAYNKIFNEFYRDQDLQTPVNEASDAVQQIAWEKDPYTGSRPWTQKGPTVTLPLGTSAPIIPKPGENPLFTGAVGWPGPTNQSGLATANGSTNVQWAAGAAGATVGPLAFASQTGLLADLSGATAADVNDVRRAMALQRWAEARAQFGSRYTEYLRYLGVRSSDARLQRPEYLGGGKATISFSEVLNTGGTDDGNDVPTGNLSGHGITALRTRPFVRFFEEHGYIMVLASVRPKTLYASGIERSFTKTTREEYFTKELELIGQQEVRNYEVYANHSAPGGVFGYNDRYFEYRNRPSFVAGEFRTTLSDWHFGRIFASDPALNADFIECTPGARPFADQSGGDLLWNMVSHSIQARRMVGNRVIGRIL